MICNVFIIFCCKYFIIPIRVSSLTHQLFKNVVSGFQKHFYIFKNIFCFITVLKLECGQIVFLKLLLWPNTWLIFVNLP